MSIEINIANECPNTTAGSPQIEIQGSIPLSKGDIRGCQLAQGAQTK
jgi:hypothetical protein